MLLGTIASHGAGARSGDYDSIATVTVGAGGAANIEFTSIPSTYTHLQIRGIARSTNADNNQFNLIQFNSDTTSANYTYHGFSGDGSTTGAFSGTSTGGLTAFTITAGNSTANVFGGFVVDILDYKNTNKNKTARALSGHDQNGFGIVRFSSGVWLSNSAITSILVKPSSGNYAQYTTFALYGITAA